MAAVGGSRPVRVVYIAGSARCGTTLLDRLLGEADGFVAMGELCLLWQRGLLDDEPCSCRTPVRQCDFWRRVLREAYGDPERVDALGMARVGLSERRHRSMVDLLLAGGAGGRAALPADYAERFRALYAAIAAVSGCGVVVDSSKRALYASLLGGIPGIELSVIHLVRDSRAVTYSLRKRKVRVEAADGSPIYMGREGNSAAGCAWQWTRAHALCEALGRGGARYMRLRYEDLARSPGAALERIGVFLGEPLRGISLVGGDEVVLSRNHAPSGNPMRFTTGNVQIAADEAWRRSMPAADRRVVTALTWPLLRHYGYPLAAGRTPAAT
ncbi:MAG TPA: sulfotransferase [Chloroflexota bacterium]|nr:sulfotransferase [Chloroflexota bacterium]